MIADSETFVVLLIVATVLVAAVWLLWAVTLIVHGVWRGADRRDARRAAERVRKNGGPS